MSALEVLSHLFKKKKLSSEGLHTAQTLFEHWLDSTHKSLLNIIYLFSTSKIQLALHV